MHASNSCCAENPTSGCSNCSWSPCINCMDKCMQNCKHSTDTLKNIHNNHSHCTRPSITIVWLGMPKAR